MKVKLLLILLVFCIISSLLLIPRLMTQRKEEKSEPQIPIEEIAENEFDQLKLTYYGQEQSYKLAADFEQVIQQSGIDVHFDKMQALLQDGSQKLQQISSSRGSLQADAGLITLQGSVDLVHQGYQLWMEQLQINLNQGTFTGDQVELFTDQYRVEAGGMEADFQLSKIHFTGRPRLTVKKGDING